MSTYLIAGGAGFIGSNLCKKLLGEGNKVICIDNLLTGSEKNITDFLSYKNFTFINHDVINPLEKIDAKVDVVYHLASPASPNAKSKTSYMAFPIETLMVNSVGTKNLLDFALRNDAILVYASSSEIYGDPEVSPQRENYNGNVNPCGVRSVYDEGKRFGESICFAYLRTKNTKTVVIRIFNTFGPKMQEDDGRVVSNFIVQALKNENITIYGDGLQTRSFCYVDDLVDGLIAAGRSKKAIGEVINLGNPQEFKIKDFAEKIKSLISSSSKVVHEELPEDDPTKRKPDISKANQILDYYPKVNVEEGLMKTIAYFEKSLGM